MYFERGLEWTIRKSMSWSRKNKATDDAYVIQFVTLMVNEAMLGDFSSCGRVIFLATGLRMCGIKVFPVINMLSALIIVMPLSAAWVHFFI